MGMAGSNLHFRTTCVGMLTLLAAYTKFLWVLIFGGEQQHKLHYSNTFY